MTGRGSMDQLRSDVLEALDAADGPLSTTDVARAVEVSPIGTEAYRALLGLYDRGMVDRESAPHSGTRVLFWYRTPNPRTGESNDDQQD